MDNLWQNLKEFWTNQNVKVGRPASLAEVEQFETTHQIRLPSDFKSYLLEVNGMDDTKSELDEDLICFWSLQNIKSTIEEYLDWKDKSDIKDDFFIFADCNIRSYDFAIRVSAVEPELASVYVLYSQPQQIASSFAEYIERYVAGEMDMRYP